MSPRRVLRLTFLTTLFAMACGLPDSLHTVCDALRVLASAS